MQPKQLGIEITRLFTYHFLLIATIGVIISCSSSSSPDSTVIQFYKYLNDGEYSKAKELYTIEAKQMVEG